MSAATGIPLLIAVDHPAFAGHFPGFAVVPGAVLLDEAMLAIGAATGLACQRIAWAKFLHPVRPGQHLLVHHEIVANGVVRFEIIAGADRMVTGSLSFAAIP